MFTPILLSKETVLCVCNTFFSFGFWGVCLRRNYNRRTSAVHTQVFQSYASTSGNTAYSADCVWTGNSHLSFN